MKTRWVLAVGAAVLFTGCNSEGSSEPAEEGLSEASTVAVFHEKVDKLAKQLALAMDADSIRFLVRDAMRASLVSEHKLVLQEFVRTPTGQKVLAASASAGNRDPEQLAADIAHLPPLDFYVPSREHTLLEGATNGTTYELVKDDLHPLTNYTVNLWQLRVSPASGFFIDIHVRETDAWPNGDDQLSYVTYSPNFVGDPHLTLTDNGFTWGLKEQPNVGAFDDIK